MSPASTFTVFRLPTGESALIPSDIELKIPDQTSIDPGRLHYLVYIPWRDRYLQLVDDAYRDFFQAVLPYLHVRTTDVHVAICLPFVRELMQATREAVDERVATIAFILHDAGWSQMSEAEIAESLGVQGLALSGEAVSPKAKHAALGQEIAQRVLARYRFEPPLTESQKNWIDTAIRYHDKPWELASRADVPAAVRLVCDVDHLWSFTHENFWQDTVRKGVDPVAYLSNLEHDLGGYFVTDQGRRKARRLIQERRAELAGWEAHARSGRAAL